MHLQFVSVFLVLFLLSGKTEKEEVPSPIAIDKSFLIRDPQNGILLYGKNPFTGKVQQCYPSGQLAEETDYVDGVKQGLMLKWFSNGGQSFLGHYKNGNRSGAVKSWWRNGRIRSVAHYKQGVAHGVQQEWYRSGQLFKKYTLVKGKEEGLQQAWRENGKLYNNYVAKKGRIYGLKRSNLCFELQNEEITAN